MTISLTLSTKIKRIQKKEARTDINDITYQYFRNLINKFKYLILLDFKKNRVHNEPTEAYLFLIKHISKLIKIKNHVPLRTKRVKLDVDKNVSTKKSTCNYFDECGRI